MNGTHGNTVVGTLIGTDATGHIPLINGGDGVLIVNSSSNSIGRSAASPGVPGIPANVIAFNGADGVAVQSGSRNGIVGNSIYENALLGIDLGPEANGNPAAPVLISVVRLPMALQVTGMLTSTKNTTFTIELFASDISAPSGRLYLGALKVRTNASGVATFTFAGAAPAERRRVHHRNGDRCARRHLGVFRGGVVMGRLTAHRPTHDRAGAGSAAIHRSFTFAAVCRILTV